MARLGQELSWDPLNIRLSSNASIHSKQSIKRSSSITLQEMLQYSYYNSPLSVLYYELLDIPLSELDTKRFLKVFYLDRNYKDLVS